MQYPVTLSFKILALAPQLYLRDAAGQSLLYVRQKMFKLREHIHVFRSDAKTEELFQIRADRVIDFSARYSFTDPGGTEIGAVRRRGGRSLWKATYDVFGADDQPLFTIEEESAWVKFLDGVIGEIPVVGAFTGYFLNPTYLLHRPDGDGALKVVKHRSFLESKFEIRKDGSEVEGPEEIIALLAILMMVLLERDRG